MNLQYTLSPAYIGQIHHHPAIKTARAQKSWVKHVGAVSSRDEDHTIIGFETVHFDQSLVQCLLALIVPTADARAPVAANRVYFIDKYDARGTRLALLE